MPKFNWGRSLSKYHPIYQLHFILLCTSITNEGLHTILVTCDLFPVVMPSFNTAASLLLEPLINMHLMICHTLFKTIKLPN